MNLPTCWGGYTPLQALHRSVGARGDGDVLGRQEEDDAQSLSVHLGDRDGEDQDPRDDADQSVNHDQGRISQQQPHVGGETTLQGESSVHHKHK